MKKIILLSILSLLVVPFFANASLNTNLYYGLQQNSDVKQLQEFLIDKSFLNHEPTGNFFSLTLNAVKAYQKKQGIIQTGYVGILTRTAINSDLETQLQPSNSESTTETGTIPPAPVQQKTTNDVVKSLQYQINLLIQQLALLQSQQTTTQQLQQTVQQQSQTIQQQTETITQIQQNTQQIVQNTCSPNWNCGSWNTCSNSLQTRVCSDSNSCNTSFGKPTDSQSCKVSGCTDKTMKNYNSLAQIDDGSCLAWPALVVTCTGGYNSSRSEIDWIGSATGGNGSYKYGWDCSHTYNANDGTFTIHNGDNFRKQCFTEPSTYSTDTNIQGATLFVNSLNETKRVNCIFTSQ